MDEDLPEAPSNRLAELDAKVTESNLRVMEALERALQPFRDAQERSRARQGFQPCWVCLRPTGSFDAFESATGVLTGKVDGDDGTPTVVEKDLMSVLSDLPAMDGAGEWVPRLFDSVDGPHDYTPDEPLDFPLTISSHNEEAQRQDLTWLIEDGTSPEDVAKYFRDRTWTVGTVAGLLGALQPYGLAAYVPELAGWVRPHTCDSCLSAVLSGQIRPRGRGATPIRDPVSPRLRFQVMQRDGFRCTYCGRTAATGATLHVDHVVPVAMGGGSEEDNLVTSCEECNFGKGANPLP